VVERRRRQLDLAGFGEFIVQRDDLPQDLDVLLEQAVLVTLGKVAALVAQFAQLGVLLEGEGVDPGEVEPDLQVARPRWP
jgi:hypothetical protein